MLLGGTPGSSKFNLLYARLIAADIARSLIPDDPFPPPKIEDLNYLLSSATRLCLQRSDTSERALDDCRLAYEIAVRAPSFGNGSGPAMSAIADLILTRLGNFPARSLLRSNSPAHLTRDRAFELEARILEGENEAAPSHVLLTDFQAKLVDALESSLHVSVSAPTSAGKSFTLELELLRRLRQQASYAAAFLVPTRALIRQVSLDLIALIRENNLETLVLSSPNIPQNAPDVPAQYIFVMTQERFATLLAEAPQNLTIDVIVVDEAQEIGKDSRGITLERVLKLALFKYPGVRLFFSSPLRSNPELLLEIFGKTDANSVHFVEHLSPVTQNLISIRPVKGSPKLVRLEATLDKATVHIQDTELPFAFRGAYMGFLAHHFTRPGDASIIYANGPASAYTYANEVATLIEKKSTDPDLEQFAAFLRSEVHRFYRLADLVEKGICFHYANLPQIIRGRIEDLVKDRKIQYVCCTSTLLQGMNLPAKNVFIENPKTGRGGGSAMSRGDFWNLAGRAGRLTKEFTGNVFCVFGKPWDSDLLKADKLVPIQSAYRVAIRERTRELAFYAETLSTSPDDKQAWAEQAFANVYADTVFYNQRLVDSVPDPLLRNAVDKIDAACTAIRNGQTLPDELFVRNLYVHPLRLEDLATFFRGQGNLELWMPLSPFADRGAARLTGIFKVIEEVLLRSQSKRYLYFGFLGSRWMQGVALRELITDRLKFRHVPNEEKEINAHINQLFEEIEKNLRFTYVKYSNVYCQVLKAVLRESGLSSLADKMLPIHMFLEFGASSETLINLMSNGLSRTSALLLRSATGLPADLDVLTCRTFLQSVNVERANLPSVCKAEVLKIQGRSQ